MDEIALALGGGGIKGIAHIGVIRVLEQEGFHIKAIAGTSAGGIVGALLAAGHSIESIVKMLVELNNPRFYARKDHDGPSLLGLAGLNEFLKDEIGDLTFDQLRIPFACTSVDLHSGQEVILARGPLIDAIMATTALPGIFPPRTIGEYQLVDGGVLDPVPVALARWLAPSMPIIAVCLHPVPEKWVHIPQELSVPVPPIIPRPLLDQFVKMRFGQAFQIFVNSMDTTSRMLTELRLQQERPDVLIRPDVTNYGLFDRVDPHQLIQLGEQAAQASLSEIRQALSWSNQLTRFFKRADPPGMVLPTTRE